MKVIFMGTPDFATAVFEKILEAGHEIVLAVTQPDRPKGRGGKLQYSAVKECALAHKVPVFQPRRVREPECIRALREYEADICVVVAFGQILPKEILEMTPYGCVNVHASLLPRYRGAAPIQWAVIDGEEESGVTTMQMDEGLDTGDILEVTRVPLDEKETGGSLFDKLSRAGAELLVHTLASLEAGTVTPQKQGESPTAYARMLTKQDGKLDWSRPAAELERLVRGLDPWPGAYTDWNGTTLKIWEAQVVPRENDKKEIDGGAMPAASGEAAAETAPGGEATPGTIVQVGRTDFSVQTGRGLLKVKSLQIPGKKRMDADAFLRGYRMTPGERLA